MKSIFEIVKARRQTIRCWVFILLALGGGLAFTVQDVWAEGYEPCVDEMIDIEGKGLAFEIQQTEEDALEYAIDDAEYFACKAAKVSLKKKDCPDGCVNLSNGAKCTSYQTTYKNSGPIKQLDIDNEDELMACIAHLMDNFRYEEGLAKIICLIDLQNGHAQRKFWATASVTAKGKGHFVCVKRVQGFAEN